MTILQDSLLRCAELRHYGKTHLLPQNEESTDTSHYGMEASAFGLSISATINGNGIYGCR
eukprot:CAMPEP_0169159106 /NCGR_PEP_ID=MMETSP1015-20121227/55578_1 /TAXON_ID=342587 /ORGANISM="Karlodinium micrum, Strain CCMP2283" /LENGTH=59 /DNA_ID=CAMNT_0009230361 /DNA_START=38 /DNA_END=213 /DNA_ORIENTATION=-